MTKSTQLAPMFVFEGVDGAGKTTLVSAVQNRLRSMAIDSVATSFPGMQPSTLGQHVYDLHHSPQRFGIGAISSSSLQLLHIAAHLDAIERSILPALRAGTVVLLDRYWWSTWAYGIVNGVSIPLLQSMLDVEAVGWKGILPATLFLIERPATVREPALVAAYTELASGKGAESGYPVIVLSNTGSIETLVDKVVNVIANYHGGVSGKKVVGRPVGRAPSGSQGPMLDTKPSLTKPSKVYDTYWKFAAERQEIFFRQFKGGDEPLTQDSILLKHKFTNAYRASDRVSQYLIRNVIYGNGDQTPQDVFFRTILFKLFNRIDTWELLKDEFGEVRYSEYRFDHYDRLLTRALEAGARIYSAAYIMPAAMAFSVVGDRKHRSHLRLLEAMMNESVPERLNEARSMSEAFNILRSYPMLGDFLAFQFITDLNYSTLMNFSEQEFVLPGPGARDGLRKCFSDFGGFAEADLIHWVMDRQDVEFERLGVQFKSLWGRPLQLIDCQNLFCEVGKYARLAHPDVVGLSGRTRIKQTYRPSQTPIAYWYPPKWGINDKICGSSALKVPTKSRLWG